MMKINNPNSSADQLRRKAERLARTLSSTSDATLSAASMEEMQKLLRDLSLHQIELETQNEELQKIYVELDASRFRYFNLFELAPVGYLTVSGNGCIQDANLTAASLLCVPQDAFLNQPFVRFVHPDDVNSYYRQEKSAFETLEPLIAEVRLVRPDQSVFWAHLVIKALQQDDDTKLLRLVLSDISKHKALEISLYESEERYRHLFESATDALLVIDSESGWILDANARAMELYAANVEELSGMRCWELAASEESASWLASEILSKPDGILTVSSHQHRKKDGTIFPVEITARSLSMEGRQCFFMAVRDISERTQNEEVMRARLRLLRAANRLTLDDFLRKTLDEAEALTNSQISFFHLMNLDQKTVCLQSWSTNTFENLCKADAADRHYSVDQAGVWTECIHRRQAVIHNDYASLPLRKVLPVGHVQIIRELVVPVVRDDLVVALIGIGNKPVDYTEQDIQIVATLADLAWDIAQRKQAENALRESEEHYRLLFEAASDALFFINVDTDQITQVNERAVALYGYSRQQLLSMLATDLSVEKEKTRQFLNEAHENPDTVFHVPIRLHRKMDGTVFPAEISGRSLPYKGHTRLLISVRDISKRVAQEMALRISEQQRLDEQKKANDQLEAHAEGLWSIYQALDSVGLIVCKLTDTDARIEVFNIGAEKLFGCKSEAAIGKSIGLIYPPEKLDIIPRRVEALSSGKAMHSFDMTLVRHSGERFPAVISLHPFSHESGRCTKVVGVFQDISELMQVQAQLEAINMNLERRVEERTRELQETQKQYLHAEKLSALGKLSASIAHEFNNPLQGILSILKGLQKRAILEPEDQKLLRAAIGESERIRALIRSLQEFNRPSAGNKTLVDIHNALDSLLLLYKSDLKKKQITVECRYAQRLPHIMAVSDQIKQVFLNLLANAAEACQSPGGRISITTKHEQDKVIISVADTGVGIPPENLQSIFQPFFTTKDAIKGTGLGLSVCHGILTNHGGSITVESQQGRGSTFTVELPVLGYSFLE